MVREKLQAASFNNNPFLMVDESVSRGKKIVTHEYPDSNRRFSEDLGKAPPIINVIGLVYGSDAIQKRFALEQALESPGLGQLIHPSYGKLQVSSGAFTVTSNQNSFGEFRFRMTFYTSDSNISPRPKGITKEKVSSNASAARLALNNALGNVYSTPQNASGIIAAGGKLSDNLNNLHDKMIFGKHLIDSKLSAFTNIIETQVGNVYKTVGSITSLKSTIKSAFNAALELVDSPDLLAESWASITDFNLKLNGATIDTGTTIENRTTSDIGSVSTFKRLIKEQNNSAIDEYSRVSGLVNSFESLAYKQYDTDNAVTVAREFLDNRYTNYVEKALADATIAGVISIVADIDLRNSLNDLRNSTREVLDTVDKNVWRVVDINPGISPMSLAAYRYYGDLSQIDTIIGLNPSANVANFDDTIRAIAK